MKATGKIERSPDKHRLGESVAVPVPAYELELLI